MAGNLRGLSWKKLSLGTSFEKGFGAMSFSGIFLVIPFLRKRALLQESVECGLGQSAGDVGIFLANNNADPATRAVAQEFSGRYPKWLRLVHEPVQGVCASRNRGLRGTTGRFIAFLDADDFMDPDRLRFQRKVFSSNLGTALVSSW